MIEVASGLSDHRDERSALADALAQTGQVTAPDLALIFTSGAHNANLASISEALRGTFPSATVVGVAGAGAIGGGREIEGADGLSLTLARLPGGAIAPFALLPDEAPWSAERWAAVAAERGLFVFADPYSIDIAAELPTMNAAHPGVPILGGLGSAPPDLEGPRLLVDGEPLAGGAMGFGLSGGVRLSSVVAQGCRPVGPPLFVTSCDGNRIVELDGRSAVDVLQEVYAGLEPVDRALFGRALFIGVQMRDQTEYARGDFLIRNVMGIASDPAALVVAYLPERFQVVQLHVRDAAAAREDVIDALRGSRADPRGGLLVSCVGRGQGLFGVPDHDSGCFADRFGDVPLGGFFANGEIGPVQGRSYVHGYTSVFALFESVRDG